MATKGFLYRSASLVLALMLLISLAPGGLVAAQEAEPELLDPALGVSTVLSGLTTPISLAFLDEDEMLVVEKDTGMVRHVVGGEEQGVALDLAVNNFSERGLLGIAVDPDFDSNGYVYLFWTCSAPAPADSPYFPAVNECDDEPQTGEDSNDVLAVPLLGNRVDRFVWEDGSLTWDLNLVKLRVFQNDGAPDPPGQGDEDQPPRGNHDGGVITFGTDGKLYIIIGDVGRRGALQNLPFGPIAYDSESDSARDSRSANRRTVPDDQFGGPKPDDAHYAGVILRLNNDGSAPTDNPFYKVGSRMGGEVGENLQMTFAYGIRNSFGMDVDPESGNVWISENGEDAYDELNLVLPGFNSGWIQFMGPAEDIADYKEIETTVVHGPGEDFPNLQQFRWGPENIADTEEAAQRRLFELPDSHYSDPEFTWEFVIAPAAVGFVESEALGDAYEGDLFVGLAVPLPLNGPLFSFNLTEDRSGLDVDELEAENEDFNSLIGSEEFLIGENFGVVTDIETGPNGNLFIVSISNGAVYEISQETEASSTHLTAELTGEAEVPGPGDPEGTGAASVYLNQEVGEVCFAIVAADLTAETTGAHIHIGDADIAGNVVVPLEPPGEEGVSAGCVSGVDPGLIEAIIDSPSDYYVNVHTSEFPAGAIRGQLTD